MKAYIESLMLKCDKARHGELTDEEMSMLVEECKGFSSLPVLGRPILTHANARNWSALRAALAPVMQVEQQPQPSIMANINPTIIGATASSTSTALVTATFADTCSMVEELESLDEEQRNQLLDLLNETRKSKDDSSMAKEAIKSLLDKAIGFGFDALKAVIPYVWGIIMTLS